MRRRSRMTKSEADQIRESLQLNRERVGSFPRREPPTIGDIVGEPAVAKLWAHTLERAQLANDWRRIAGDLADTVRPVKITSGVLHVETGSQAMFQEMVAFHVHDLVGRWNDTNELQITSIKVRKV